MSQEINWERLRREAEEAYREEARRRQKIGEEATADAEELAARVRQKDGATAWGEVGEQDVYVYRGPVMLAHLPPSTLFNPTETPKGMALRTQLLSPSRGHYVEGPSWEPGEWTFAGRGHPGE